MKYNQPYGQTDANAHYVNGDPSIGRAGSIPPAEAFEFPQREILAVIADAGFEPTNEDLTQLLKAIKKIAQLAGVYFIVDSGTADAMAGTTTNAPPSYAAAKLIVVKKMASANSSAMTANFWNLGDVAVKDNTGATLSSGALVGGGLFILAPDGAGALRVLGGTTSYTSVSGLTTASGEAIDVTVGGVVNQNFLTNTTHNDAPGSTDLVIRQNAAGQIQYMTIAEFLDWLTDAITVAHDGTLTGSGNTGSPLGVVLATETQRGGAEVATQAEANAGVDDTTMITPKKLAAYIAAHPSFPLFPAVGSYAPGCAMNVPPSGPNGIVPGTWSAVGSPFISGIDGAGNVYYYSLFQRTA